MCLEADNDDDFRDQSHNWSPPSARFVLDVIAAVHHVGKVFRFVKEHLRSDTVRII